jgi:UDP-N-acetyl-alpha-D-muramoyl-L-alanyl-L-glutamate epimerase
MQPYTSPYKQFIFDQYSFDRTNGRLDLHYAIDDALHFTETYTFDFPFIEQYDEAAFDRAVQTLFFLAGVSYYKTYVPPEIVVKNGQLDAGSAAFFSKTYQRGLGEFFYVNKLDPRTPVNFPVTSSEPLTPLVYKGEGLLVSIGGGKDSLVSTELLRNRVSGITTWSLGHRHLLEPVVARVGLPHVWVERQWDRQLVDLNAKDALNGHVPISAIFGAVGAIIAVLTGQCDVVVANEQSANEPTLVYEGVAINHQYSKSQEFERDYQAYLKHHFGDGLRYYSFLRPMSEVFISEVFSKIAFEKYKDVFSSCNRAFLQPEGKLQWCGECAKCAFIFIAMTPFIPRAELEKLWKGKNLLLDPELEPMYRNLLGIEGEKPLDCVGEIKESRAAMRHAEDIYPELKGKYTYDLPEDYDYHQLMSDEMPADIKAVFDDAMAEFHPSSS